MNDKELEEKLKSSAKKIDLNDFSDCWDELKNRMDTEIVDLAPPIQDQSTILVTDSGTKQVRSNKYKPLLLIIACFVFVGIILSIVLPITLQKKDIKFFVEENLIWEQTTEEEFYDRLSSLKSTFPFEMETFELAFAEDGEIKGGKCNIFDEFSLCDGRLFIYEQFVTLSKYDYEEYSNSIVNTTNTVYYSEKLTADGLYKIDSIILTSSTNFRLELTFYNGNNFLLFVDKYFN